MRRVLRPSLALSGAAFAIFSATAIYAQIPARLKNCLPYPTLSDEIKEMQKEMEPVRPKVRVVNVKLVGAGGLSETTKAQLAHRGEDSWFDAGSGWPLFAAEVVQETMRNHGYFKAKVRPEARILSNGPDVEKASVTFLVTAGPQYRLGQIQFAHASVFPTEVLRKEVPLQDGDIFDLSKIRAGIDALTSLYDARGYINLVATPDVQTDDTHQRISVVMQLDEGRQFRVGSVQILGFDQQVSDHKLKIEIKPGMIFSHKLIGDFYKQNAALVPADASPRKDTTITQDARTHTVAIVFDLRTCHKVTE